MSPKQQNGHNIQIPLHSQHTIQSTEINNNNQNLQIQSAKASSTELNRTTIFHYTLHTERHRKGSFIPVHTITHSVQSPTLPLQHKGKQPHKRHAHQKAILTHRSTM